VLLLVKNRLDIPEVNTSHGPPSVMPGVRRHTRYKKHGQIRHGKQNHFRKNCARQFSADAERRMDIENLLRERISRRGICRAVGVSLPWLLPFMVACCAICPDHVHVRLPSGAANAWIYKL
jgi:hypothetical protein